MYLHEKLPTRPPYSINKVFGYCGEYVAFYIVTVVFRLIPFDIFALLSPLYQWYLGGISDPDSHSWRPPPPTPRRNAPCICFRENTSARSSLVE